MTYLQSFILSIVEGITEFLPISSTGHLILTSHLLGIETNDFVTTFEIAIQSGAMSAVILLFFRKVLHEPKIMRPLFFAFTPTAIVGITLYPIIKNILLTNVMITVVMLGLGGIVLIYLEKFLKKKNYNDQNETPTIRQALLIGTVQSISVIPGVSRAAASIIGGMFAGLSREKAVEFSFLLAVPTIFSATALDLLKTNHSFQQQEIFVLIVGFIGAFISAFFAIKFLISFIKKNSLEIFGYYRIILAIFFWIITLTK